MPYGTLIFLSLSGLPTLFRYRVHVWITSSTASGLEVFHSSLEIFLRYCKFDVSDKLEKKNSYQLPGIASAKSDQRFLRSGTFLAWIGLEGLE